MKRGGSLSEGDTERVASAVGRGREGETLASVSPSESDRSLLIGLRAISAATKLAPILLASLALLIGLNEGGGGGYTQLPTCRAGWYGATAYFQGHIWLCVHDTLDHWLIVG